MSMDSAVSRRVSEFTGVVLFGASLLWLIALVTATPNDPVWFFNDLPGGSVTNFAGPIGAFISTVTLQLVGVTGFLLPVVVAAIGWRYFWCSKIDAGYTKLIGAAAFMACLAGLLTL